ncbi:MAG: carbamoyltransferase [Candidatus Aenigmatarchaeota archaeon]
MKPISNNLYILGICGQGHAAFDLSGIGHDPAAALIKDGKLIAAAEEERFIRLKHARGHFPYNAIKFCLDYAGIGIEDIDYIVGNFKPELISKIYARDKFFKRPLKAMQITIGSKVIKKKYLDCVKRIPYFLKERKELATEIIKKFETVEHHLAHASSAYHVSGFDKSNIITMDACGEATTTLISKGEDGLIKKIRETFIPQSIGGFYSLFTEYLGFEPNDGEYKVMGLAPYGKKCIDVSDLIKVVDGCVVVDQKINGSYYRYSEYVINRFGPPRKKGDVVDERHANIAYAIQERLEEICMDLLKFSLGKIDSKNLCLAGGVALNSKMNGKLLSSGLINNIFIQPAAGDAGTAIGAAFYKYVELGYKPNEKMEHVYYGPEFTNEEIENALKLSKVKYEFYDDISGICAELIAKGNIVGWFQGRMEWGPRALGNRSILADPRNPKMKDLINQYVKFREEFRPFCPSMLASAAKEYLEGAYPSPFMILTFKVPEEKRREIPAVVHVDGTVRPQTVEKHINERFYNLIKSFEELTSVPVVLNTSFNIAGEPIVCRPIEAIRTFYSCGMDYLAIGNYLIKK